jgi:hypothetical protein
MSKLSLLLPLAKKAREERKAEEWSGCPIGGCRSVLESWLLRMTVAAATIVPWQRKRVGR